MYKLDIAAPNN